MTVRSKSDIITNVQTDLADNNAGLISAADIRNNILDIVESIETIVGSGNYDGGTPFSPNNVRAKIDTSVSPNVGGFFVAESGLKFPNNGNTTQYVAYPGPEGISHSSLADLTAGNPHTQYMSITGANKATHNMPLGAEWINSSGNLSGAPNTDNRGLKFEYTATSVSGEIIHIGSDSTVKFDVDNSYTLSGKGFAQAWIRFEGTSGNVVVNSSYNIDTVEHTNNGHYKVFFTENTFSDSSYTVVGLSNAIGGSGSAQDFDVNTIGVVERNKDYLMFLVKSDDNEYVNAAINDIVVFGNASGVTPSSSPTVVNLPT